MKRLFAILLILLPLALVGAQDEPLHVITTSNILADVARNVGGDRVMVDSLIPPGADGHAWQPTPSDVLKVARADLVLAVGVGYETFLGQLVENAADVPQVIVSSGIPILPFAGHDEAETAESTPEAGHDDAEYIGVYGEAGVCEDDHTQAATAEADHANEEAPGQCDPHVWTDPTNVMIWVDNIADALAQTDPANAEVYRANATAYQEQLAALDAEVAAMLAEVPEARRVLVTNHEFLGYFAHRYGFKVVGGILGATTLEEPDPQRLAALATEVKALGVPAIFAEVSANSPFAQVIAQEAGIRVVSNLYSESLSDINGPAATYLDYLRYNAQTIADALKPV
ncbi:MAG: zinc ABC transporter substrate-binding protein [Chloroflexi bacterium]|nr:zinc ABC transporter substrate-binding protein [Chloroflexota bacterium]